MSQFTRRERRERRGEERRERSEQCWADVPTPGSPGDAMALMLESIVLNEIPHTKPAGRGLHCPDWLVWWHRRPNWCSVITQQIRSDYLSDLSGLVCLVPGGSWLQLVVVIVIVRLLTNKLTIDQVVTNLVTAMNDDLPSPCPSSLYHHHQQEFLINSKQTIVFFNQMKLTGWC